MKHYTPEKVIEIGNAIDAAPSLQPKQIPVEKAIQKLAKKIRVLHFTKNYSPKEIALLLQTHEFKISLAAIKNILKNEGTEPKEALLETKPKVLRKPAVKRLYN
jgi:hypothetical protein